MKAIYIYIFCLSILSSNKTTKSPNTLWAGYGGEWKRMYWFRFCLVLQCGMVLKNVPVTFGWSWLDFIGSYFVCFLFLLAAVCLVIRTDTKEGLIMRWMLRCKREKSTLLLYSAGITTAVTNHLHMSFPYDVKIDLLALYKDPFATNKTYHWENRVVLTQLNLFNRLQY